MKKHTTSSIKHLLLIFCFLGIFAGITLFLFGYHQDEKRFQHLTSRLFEQEMTSSTLNMHYSLAYPADFGIFDYEVLLPGYSREASLSGQAATENLLKALSSLNVDKLNEQDAYTYKLLIKSLENSLALNSFSYYEEPLSPSSGMQSQLPILLAEYTFRTKKDVTDYLQLLDQTDEYFDSLLRFTQEKAAAGLLMPSSSLQEVIQQCDTIVSKEELAQSTHFLQTTFKERLAGLVDKGEISEAEAAKFIAYNDRILTTVLQPAYESLGDGLCLLEASCNSLAGLAAKPQGKEYYKQLLIAETGSYRSVEDIKAMLTERLKQEYTAIRTLAAENPQIAEQLSSQEAMNFPYTDADVMLADLTKRMKKDFPTFPTDYTGLGKQDTREALPSVTVKAVSPSLEPYCAPAFYLTAPIDDTDSNVIYINHKNSPSGLELYTTLAHEGYPGHLYQTVYSNRSFLKKGENKARQLLWYGGYLEGWALYVEFISFNYASQLLLEQGRQLDAACIQLEKHNRSMQLCLYCLLDIMIHYENASYSQITDVLEGFGIQNARSVSAIYSYIAEEPCNYLKYYLGYLEILELKKAAQKQWGTNYSDYAFHTFYLDCGPSDFTSLAERLQTASPY